MNAKLALLLLVVFFAGAATAGEDSKLKAGVFSPPRQAPELNLQGSDGKALQLSRFRGKIVLLGFGFTSCPDVCPTTLAVLAQARKQLGSRADELQVVYVTVDPQTDSAERMRKYLATFDSTFLGGTGTEEQLAAVRKEYGIIASKKTVGANSTFAHSSYIYLIDRDGELRGLMPYGHSAADFSHDIEILLAD